MKTITMTIGPTTRSVVTHALQTRANEFRSMAAKECADYQRNWLNSRADEMMDLVGKLDRMYDYSSIRLKFRP